MEQHIKGVTEDIISFDGGFKLLEGESWGEKWDRLVWEAVFGAEKEKARYIIWEVGQSVGVKPSSINDLYMARGRGETPPNFTVPAINIRGMAYDMARAIFSTSRSLNVGALICEIARSEMGYTDQTPQEYTAVVVGAAIREGWRGPLFIQGDHFQTKEVSPGVPKEGEVEAVRNLITDAVSSGFYNIDIDTSTLVDLGRDTEEEQQESNVSHSLLFAKHVREIEPQGVTVSLGGEIGHIGGKNSTVSEFEAYMKGFTEGLPSSMTSMSKISVQTGTSHGGVVMEDGTLADVDVDFSVLHDISVAAREEYQLGGAVQHGASTLPDEFFSEFPKHEAIEVHLATGFQNIIMDHPDFPKKLLGEMYQWLDEEKSSERGEGQSEEQFHYKLRKKAWGRFKRECWSVDGKARESIRETLSSRFEYLFKSLNVINTKDMVEGIVTAPTIHKTLDDFSSSSKIKEVKGLSD